MRGVRSVAMEAVIGASKGTHPPSLWIRLQRRIADWWARCRL